MCIIITSFSYCFEFVFKVDNIAQMIRKINFNYQLLYVFIIFSDEVRRVVDVNSNYN